MSQLPCPFCDAPLAGDAAGPPAFCGACGRPLRVCGGYRVTGLLGRGGMGAVFSGYREADRQPVAIKILVPRTAGDWTAWELFERSTRVLQGLRHPGLPTVYAFERAEPARLILVREAFDGGTLEERIRVRDARLDARQVTALLESLLELLAYLESRVPPVVHRDIKPANIMFRTASDWSPVLVDFDTIAAPEGAGSGLTIVGTPGYTAPEQFAGDASPASDLYSLGATLLFVVTHLDADALPRDKGHFALGDRLAGLPPRLRAVLERMVEPDRSARFPGAAAALAELRAPEAAPVTTFTPPGAIVWSPYPAEPAPLADSSAPEAPVWAPGLTPPRSVDDSAELEVARKKKKRYSVDSVAAGIGIALGVLSIPAFIVIMIAVQSPTPPTPPTPPPPPVATGPAPPAPREVTPLEKCQQGDVKECSWYGHLHDFKHRPEAAYPFVTKGCELGDGRSCDIIGKYHERGWSVKTVKKDFERALKFYARACELKYTVGCLHSADGLSSGPKSVQDLKGAFAAYQRACDLGDKKGCFEVGAALHDGLGTKVDLKASAEAYRRACDQKHPRACRNLGLRTAAGQGVTRDLAAAAALFTKACDLGETDGCIALARALVAGRGIAKDEERALSLMRGQCRGGDKASCKLFEKLKRTSR